MQQARSGERSHVRRNIIDAVLELAASQGVHNLTTVAIAKRAGIRQPNFYNHFKNIDDCLAAAVRETVLEQLRLDEEVFEQVNAAIVAGQPYMHLSIAYHRKLLERLLLRPEVTALFMRHRGEPTSFGAELQKLHHRTVAYVVSHIWDWAVAAGLSGKHLQEIKLLGELQVGMLYACAMVLVSDGSYDLDMGAASLAWNADAMIKSTLKRLTRPPAPSRSE